MAGGRAPPARPLPRQRAQPVRRLRTAHRTRALWLDPRLPSALGRLALELRYRGHRGLAIAVDRRTVTVSLREDRQGPVRIRPRGTEGTILRSHAAGGAGRARPDASTSDSCG
ncbi:glycosyl hydrolase family 65 protein [Kitasatospora sp. NPDC094028]